MLIKATSSEEIQSETTWRLALKIEFVAIQELAKMYVGSGTTSARNGSAPAPASVASDEARRKLQEVKPFTEREGRRLERDNLRLTRAELDY